MFQGSCLQCEWGIASRSLPVAAGIGRNYSEVFRQRVHLMLKVAAVLAVSVEQDQRKSRSLFNVVVLNIHDYPKGMKKNQVGLL